MDTQEKKYKFSDNLFYIFVGTLVLGFIAALGYLLYSVFSG